MAAHKSHPHDSLPETFASRSHEALPQPTRGPWKWFNYPDGRKLLCGPECAVIHCPDAPIAIEPADAALVAAAPDLLDGCRALLGLLTLLDARDDLPADVRTAIRDSHRVEEAQAAIAKAEGR